MNYLKVLYAEDFHDKVFNFLKQKFGGHVTEVAVEILVPNQLVEVTWIDLIDAGELAAEMTKHVPEVVIETKSTTGIDQHSRFFNEMQLW